LFTVTNSAISTLNQLNQGLGTLTNVTTGTATLPLTAAMFDQTGAPTAAEIDQAVANCSESLYEYLTLDDLVDSLNKQLAPIVADPVGYTLEEEYNAWAYINSGNFALDDQATKLLVKAANDPQAEARHQTSDATGVPTGASAYIHAYGPNKIYAFSEDGTHRGYPKVTVLAEGDVSSGTHRF
jgi:hypothetical protein